MARVLVATTPADGHVNPIAPIVAELTRRGHEARWYTGAAYHDRIAAAGAAPEPMRKAYDFGGKDKAAAFPEQAGLTGLASFRAGMTDIFYGSAPDQLHDLLALLRRFPADVILSDDMCYGACFAHELTHIPQVWVGNSVYILGSRDTGPLGFGLGPSVSAGARLRNRLLSLSSDHLALRPLRDRADAVRAQVGLPKLRTGAMENIARRPDLYLVGTVEAFEFPRSDLFPGTRFVGALDTGSSDTPFQPPTWWDEVTSDRKVVLVTQGTVANDVRRLLIPAIAALADADLLVIVITGNAELEDATARSLPANVRVQNFLPYHQLLPHVEVMISNGGFNGVNAALRNGVPMVIAGATEEKSDVAARVRFSGSGIALGRQSLTPQRIRRAVDTVLSDPRYRTAAQRLREHYHGGNGPHRAADLVEGLLSGVDGSSCASVDRRLTDDTPNADPPPVR